MKSRVPKSNRFTTTLAALGLVSCLLASRAGAGILVLGQQRVIHSEQWHLGQYHRKLAASSTLTSSKVVWTAGDLAVFTAGSTSAGAITVTVNAPISFGGIDNNGVAGSACTLTLVNGGSGSLSLASGTQGFYTSSGYSTAYYLPISGAGGVEPQGSGTLYFYATNSYTGGTTLDQTGLLEFTNGAVFGTGPITMANTGGALINNWTGPGPITITNAVTAGTFNLISLPAAAA